MTANEDKGIDVIQRWGRPGSVAVQRNNIPCKSPGDKNYNHPVLSPHFYKREGIVPCSTAFQKRYSSYVHPLGVSLSNKNTH